MEVRKKVVRAPRKYGNRSLICLNAFLEPLAQTQFKLKVSN